MTSNLTKEQESCIREAVSAAIEEFGKDAERRHRLVARAIRGPIKEQSGDIAEFIIRYTNKYAQTKSTEPRRVNEPRKEGMSAMQQLLLTEDEDEPLPSSIKSRFS